MKQLRLSILFILIACGIRSTFGNDALLVVKTSRPDAVYSAGTVVEWEVSAPATQPTAARYNIKPFGGPATESGAVTFVNGRAVIRATPPGAATLLLEVSTALDDSKETVTRAGAVVDPEHITPVADAPDDFGAFWDEQIKSGSAIPLNPQVTSLPSGRDNIVYEQIELDNIARTKVHGQLARPSGNGKYPAILIVQWAGVYPLQKAWVLDRAAEGWLALNVSAHDLPIDRPDAFYKELSEGALKNYPMIGSLSRETSYFLRMYHSCHRAIDYLASRPDWDGRTIVVTGTSQGGMLAVITAAMRPERVTALMANVPAGCDTLSYTAQRATGWPYWYGHARGKPDETAIMNTSRYFDAANFASRVRCPALVSVGLIDLTCPPAGVIGMFNRLAGPKELVVMPASDHKGTGNTQAPFHQRARAWSEAIAREGTVPVNRTKDGQALRNPRVFSLDAPSLMEGRRRALSDQASTRVALKRLREDADKLLTLPNVAVTDKKPGFIANSGDPHDYTSLSVYYWPDQRDPKAPWIRVDGKRNHDGVNQFDSPRLFMMCNRVITLAQAYYFTDDRRYARAAVEQLRVWFLNPATRMNPNLDYAQFVPNLNKGTQWGIIDINRFHDVYNAIGLLEISGEWTAADDRAMREWVSELNRWLTTSKNGVDERKAFNNHGVYYDMQVAAGAMYVGDSESAGEVLSAVPTTRYASQIEADGSMPHELARVDAASYTGMNLNGFIALATMADKLELDLWNAEANGRGLERAVRWTIPFVEGRKKWTAGDGKFGPNGLLNVYWIASRRYKGDIQAALENNLLPNLAPESREASLLNLLWPRD